MLAVKLPDETSPRKADGRKTRAVKYSPAELESIREAARTKTDAVIAAEMGWSTDRVRHIRISNNIPMTPVPQFWTEERLALAHDLYIVKGQASTEVAPVVGCTAIALRLKSLRMGWVHCTAATNKNRIAAIRRRFNTPDRAALVKAAFVALSADEPAAFVHRPGAQLFSFASPRLETETLGDRILRELSAKPLSTCSLATLLGEKELLVSRQLKAFEYEGVVVGGVVDERGARYQPWSLVTASVAESAASLRCGPDSSVVAGEAA